MAEPGGRVGQGLRRHALPTLVPFGLGVLALHRDQTGLGLGLMAFAVVFLVARILSRGRIDRGLAAFGRIFGRVAVAVFVFVFNVLVVVPSWAVGRILGQDAMGRSSGWTPPEGVAGPRHWFSLERPVRRTRPMATASMLVLAIGIVPVILATDLALGTAWGWIDPGPGSRPPPTAFPPVVATDRPAVAHGVPWTPAGLHTFERVTLQYWPFLIWRTKPTHTSTVQTDGWVRRSANAATGPAPVVGFFGGSECFGVGQDDAHTIPSVVAGLARAAGLPIVPSNQCQPRYTWWQSWLRFEQATSESSRPAIAMFVDGADEFSLVSPGPTVPSFVNEEEVRFRIEGPPVATLSKPLSQHQDLRFAYDNRSFVVHLWRALFVSPPKRLTVVQPRPTADYRYHTPVARPTVTSEIGVAQAGRDLATFVGREHHVPTLFAWEPVPATAVSDRAAAAGIGAPTSDLSGLLDGVNGSFRTDGSLTDRGVGVLAAALWKQLRPSVESWYAQHR